VSFNGAASARAAGYSVKAAKEQASRLLTRANVRARIDQLHRKTEERLQISRDDVLRGFLSAYNDAKLHGQPMAMVAAMREVGKMLGYYSPEHHKVELSAGDEHFKSQLAQMSERELLRLARGNGEGGG